MIIIVALFLATAQHPSRAQELGPYDAVFFDGSAFDSRCAQPLATMDAWRGDASNPYNAAGIYIGGRNKSCRNDDVHLTADWVRAIVNRGWRLIPTFVGSQAAAPCNSPGEFYSIDGARASAHGTEEADEAVAVAQGLGIGPGNPIYFDMEHYNRSRSTPELRACADAALQFLSAWARQLKANGYVPGIYSSASSGIREQSENYDNAALERFDNVWYAWWDREPCYQDAEERYFKATQWVNRRIHQYRGGHDETYGGATLRIDSNCVRGQVLALANKVEFSAASYSANENAGLVSIKVVRKHDASAEAHFSFSASAGSASDGSDFTSVGGTMEFLPGERERTFDVPILDDDLPEPAETIRLALSDPQEGTTFGANATATLTIRPSDQFPDSLIRKPGVAYAGANLYNMTASGQRQWLNLRRGQTGIFYVVAQNDGNAPTTFTVSGRGSGGGFSVRYFTGDRNIGGPVVRGAYTTGSLAPGKSQLIKVYVYVSSTARIGVILERFVTVSWQGDSPGHDVVLARAGVAR